MVERGFIVDFCSIVVAHFIGVRQGKSKREIDWIDEVLWFLYGSLTEWKRISNSIYLPKMENTI